MLHYAILCCKWCMFNYTWANLWTCQTLKHTLTGSSKSPVHFAPVQYEEIFSIYYQTVITEQTLSNTITVLDRHRHANVLKRQREDCHLKQTLQMFQHIRMISEGSCDTEDLSNDAENSAAHHKNLYFNIMQPWWAEETSFKTSKNLTEPKLN